MLSPKGGNKISNIGLVKSTSTADAADEESTPQTLLAVVTDESAMPSIYNIASRNKVVKKNADPKVGILLLAISP